MCYIYERKNNKYWQSTELAEALFDFTGKSMNKASQVPQKSNVVDHCHQDRRSMKRS